MPPPTPKSYYVATPDENDARFKVYTYLEDMRRVKTERRPHFTDQDGQMSWTEYIDFSERYLNGYTLSREDQGKEAWQSNTLDNITRAKLKAIAAGVGLRVPGMEFDAVNDNGVHSATRADIFKNIVTQSFNESNPTLMSYREVWTMMAHGVVFEYEGYKTGGGFQDVVESFDSVTGEVKTKRLYRKMDGKPFTVLLNPQEFYWWDMQVSDVQDQQRVAWVQHYSKRDLELEFSKFPNFKYIKDKQTVQHQSPLQGTLFFKSWANNVQDRDDYEVIRMFSKADDGNQKGIRGYEVWCNGVPLLRSPLLWGDKEKVYPFSKQIAEPFANTNFFVGMSLPGLLAAYQDQKNTVFNTMVDKLYRSMTPPMLVGLGNRDLLDVESEMVNQDNRYYVPDVNQVKPYPIQGINQAELAMLSLIDRQIEGVSVDRSQQGLTGAQKTAHQAVIEDARAKELKGALYMSLEDLWYQKTKLRTQILLTHYLKDKAAQETTRGQIITVKNYTFGDGERGTLDIHVAKTKGKLLTQQEVDARAQAAEEQGMAYKLISITEDYLNDWIYDFHIVPQSLHNQDSEAKKQELMGELQAVATLFPEFFVANKDNYVKELLAIRGKHIDEFNPPAPPAPPQGPGGPGAPGAPGAPAGPGGPPGGAPAPQGAPSPAAPQPSPVLGLQ